MRRAPESQVRHDPLRAAILVSGGLAPGINATIEGIVERHEQYTAAFREGGQHYTIELGGYQEGFKALIGTAVHTHLKKIAEDLTPQAFLQILPQDQHERLLLERLGALQ